MPCREHWLQLQRHRQTWQQLGVEIYIVTFDDTELARAYAEKNAPDWPLLIDPDREVYSAFGMGRAGWWTLLKPSSLWKYFTMWLRGARPQKVGSDIHQLGGDVLIDPGGILRLDYVSQTPHDRPAVEDLIEFVKHPQT